MVLKPPFPADRGALAASAATRWHHLQCIHGLTIASDTHLPGASPAREGATRGPDVVLHVLDERLEAPPASATLRFRSPGAGSSADATLLVHVLDDGRTAFRYSDGTAFDIALRDGIVSIHSVIGAGQTLEDMAVYLYGPVLGFVLRSLGRLALHAGCVAIDGGAVAFVGASGAGKSTTVAALALRGASLLADDLVALELHNSRWLAHPAFDHVRVWSTSEPLLYGRAGVLERITPGWDKLRVPLTTNFALTPVPLRALYLLEWDEDAVRTRISPVDGPTAVIALASDSYSNYLLDPAQKAAELAQLGDLVSRVPVRRLARTHRGDALDDLCLAIERDALAQCATAP